jgi:hypothetical protein
LLANAVDAFISDNRLVDFGEETRGLFRSPFSYGEGAILLSFVEFDVCARISLRDLKEYSSLRKLCRNIGNLFSDNVLSTVETVKLGTPTGEESLLDFRGRRSDLGIG